MSFINAALILVVWGADYLGLLLIIVYVGAIAILFLFVVMMINIKTEETNRVRFIPIGVILGIVLMVEVYLQFPMVNNSVPAEIEGWGNLINGGESNVERIGSILYSWEVLMYAGLILLVAMIGAIILTLNHSEGVKRSTGVERLNVQSIFSKWA